MVRKTIIALAASAALGAALIPTAALARGGFSHGGMHMAMHSSPMMHTGPHTMHMSAFRDHDHDRFMRFHHDRDHDRFGRFRDRDHDRDFRFRHRFAFIGFPYAYDSYDDSYDSCYQVRRVLTSFGWRLRRVYACY